MRHRSTTPLVALSATLLCFTTPAFAQQVNSDIQNIGNRDINRSGIRLMTPDLESEIAMGRQTASELEQKVTLIQDPAVTEYVNRVGQNIVRNSDAKVPFTIRVIDSDEISAIGLPGGFLYVNKGLILASDNEAELAAVMAHEIAHVTARHAVEQHQRAALLNTASVPLVVFSGGIAGMAIQQAAGIGVPLSFLQFSQKTETEADFLGLQYLYKAGYDPNAMVTSFEKLQAREGAAKKVPVLFATHPQTEDRIKQTQKSIATYLPARVQAVIPPAEFQGIKARLMDRN